MNDENTYEKNWFDTRGGRRVYLSNPKPEQIEIEDISLALSNTCRYGGHIDEFYSVAQHSVEVAHVVPEKFAFEALLHDASEAYLGDVISPLKNLLPEYRKLESLWQAAINERFDVKSTEESRAAIKIADARMLLTERRDLNGWAGIKDWPEDKLGGENSEPYEVIIYPRDPKFSRGLFMHTFRGLQGNG